MLRWFVDGAEADETTLVAIGLVLSDDDIREIALTR
jgi:hypothetical protein